MRKGPQLIPLPMEDLKAELDRLERRLPLIAHSQFWTDEVKHDIKEARYRLNRRGRTEADLVMAQHKAENAQERIKWAQIDGSYIDFDLKFVSGNTHARIAVNECGDAWEGVQLDLWNKSLQSKGVRG